MSWIMSGASAEAARGAEVNAVVSILLSLVAITVCGSTGALAAFALVSRSASRVCSVRSSRARRRHRVDAALGAGRRRAANDRCAGSSEQGDRRPAVRGNRFVDAAAAAVVAGRRVRCAGRRIACWTTCMRAAKPRDGSGSAARSASPTGRSGRATASIARCGRMSGTAR